MSLPVVVLLSGQGSNCQALIDAQQNGLAINIQAVISDQVNAMGLTRAKQAGIPTYAIPRLKTESKAAHEAKILQAISPHQPKYLLLAGYMRVLSANFIQHYPDRIFNIHPSLLPKYPGLNTFARALADRETETGTTIHVVTPTVDAGPIIAFMTVSIQADDTMDSLKVKVQRCEHQLYPQVLDWLASGRLMYNKNHFLLDGAPLPAQGLLFYSQPVI
jgi:phosphoribosylglycinamide formyltransferase-1